MDADSIAFAGQHVAALAVVAATKPPAGRVNSMRDGLWLRCYSFAIAVFLTVFSATTIRGQEQGEVEVVPNIGHSLFTYSVTFSPDGEHALSGGFDNSVKLWHLRTGQLVRTFHGNTNPVYTVAFSPDGTRVACAAGGSVKVW